MPHVNVEVSDELLKAIRMTCVQGGVKQKDWVVGVLGKAVGSDIETSGAVAVPKPRAIRKSKSVGEAVEVESERVSSAVDRTPDEPARSDTAKPKSRYGKDCPDCNIPMKDWGRFWKCQNCRTEVKK